MFTVIGTIKSVPYIVGIHDEPVEGELYGCVMGSDSATALLAAHVGEPVQATPTSSPVILDLADPASILAFLRGRTNVTRVEGDLPFEEESDPRLIY